MKRAIRVLTVILVVLEAVLPCGKWGLQRIGYTLEPFSLSVTRGFYRSYLPLCCFCDSLKRTNRTAYCVFS